jgi:hypothetical protein
MRNLPVLYLDVDGVLRYAHQGVWKLRLEAESFLEWAVTEFECRWLTSWRDPSRELPRHFGLRIPPGISETAWLDFDSDGTPLGKSAAINFKEDWRWIEDAPTSFDIERLREARQLARLIKVDPMKPFILLGEVRNRLKESISIP